MRRRKGALKAWLTTAGSKLTTGQNLNLAQLQANGCRTLKFAGRDIVEVCFARGGAVFHLYVLPRDSSFGGVAQATPTLLAQANRAAAVWSDERFHYALATTEGMEALKGLL